MVPRNRLSPAWAVLVAGGFTRLAGQGSRAVTSSTRPCCFCRPVSLPFGSLRHSLWPFARHSSDKHATGHDRAGHLNASYAAVSSNHRVVSSLHDPLSTRPSPLPSPAPHVGACPARLSSLPLSLFPIPLPALGPGLVDGIAFGGVDGFVDGLRVWNRPGCVTACSSTRCRVPCDRPSGCPRGSWITPAVVCPSSARSHRRHSQCRYPYSPRCGP